MLWNSDWYCRAARQSENTSFPARGLYWKPQIHGTEPYRLSSSTTRIKFHRKMCVCVCFCYVCGGRPNMLMGFPFFFKFHLVSINCNQVSCGFHSKKSKVKINDLQQVAMAVNKHLMNALSCLGFWASWSAWQPNKTPGEFNWWTQEKFGFFSLRIP